MGFAAIQLAQKVGARILSTASAAKHDYVRGLGVDEVYDSRSLDFRDDVLAATEQRGVDVVLNSLAGEFLRKSLEVLAPYGRFVEIGKADLVSNGQLGLKHFEDNRSFVAMDIAKRCQDRPQEVGKRLADLMKMFDAGDLRVPPIERFPLDKVADAFAHMAEGKHRGKIVLGADPSSNEVYLGQTRTEIRGDGTYVILGGGGIGGSLIDWLLASGARHIAVISRNPRSDPERACSVAWVKGDVTDAKQLGGAFARIQRDMPPIAGVVHAAGCTDDSSIASMTEAQVSSVCRTKMEGLCNLQQAVEHLSLDFLVLCSSATWFLGSHGQANYGAANAFVEAMAQAWRRRGIPATVIHFGPWDEVGIIARAGADLAGRLVDRGFAPLMPHRAVAALEDLLRRDVTSAAVMDFEAEKWLTGVRVKDRSCFFEDVMAYERAFVEAGGLLAAGVDPTGNGGALPGFGDQRNFELLREGGFTPEQAVQIMSANGAKILGVYDELGSVESGKIADLVVVEGDLTSDASAINRVTIVFKDGIGFDSAKLIAAVKGRVGIN